MLSFDDFIIRPNMDGLQAIRGHGLLGLHRPLHLPPGDVWDWPSISGRWFGGWASYAPARRVGGGWPLGMCTEPGFFTLTAVTHPQDILKAMGAFGLSSGVALDEWNKIAHHIPDLSNSPLPPVYFHGLADKFSRGSWGNGSREKRMVYGVVWLTTESPPQLRWSLSISTDDPEETLTNTNHVFQGVQVGGLGSERGVLGVSLF